MHPTNQYLYCQFSRNNMALPVTTKWKKKKTERPTLIYRIENQISIQPLRQRGTQKHLLQLSFDNKFKTAHKFYVKLTHTTQDHNSQHAQPNQFGFFKFSQSRPGQNILPPLAAMTITTSLHIQKILLIIPTVFNWSQFQTQK